MVFARVAAFLLFSPIPFVLRFFCFLVVYSMVCVLCFFFNGGPRSAFWCYHPGSRCILMGFFYTSSCLTGLYYSFFRYLAMQFLARTGFRILTVNRPCCLLLWSNDFFLLDHRQGILLIWQSNKLQNSPAKALHLALVLVQSAQSCTEVA